MLCCNGSHLPAVSTFRTVSTHHSYCVNLQLGPAEGLRTLLRFWEGCCFTVASISFLKLLLGCLAVFIVFFLNWSGFSLNFFFDTYLHCFPLKGGDDCTCNTENKWLNGIKMQTFSFILRGFWAWIDSFWMPGVAPLLLFLNFPAVLAVPWHKSISCVGFSGDGWCCRGPGRGGVRPGVPQDRGSIQQHTRVIVASHKTKKTSNQHKHATFVSTKRKRGKNEEKKWLVPLIGTCF